MLGATSRAPRTTTGATSRRRCSACAPPATGVYSSVAYYAAWLCESTGTLCPPGFVLPPPPTRTPRALVAADLAAVRQAIADPEARQHVVHPFQLANRVWCVVCVRCGFGGAKVSAKLNGVCPGPPLPSSHGARVLSNLGRAPARFMVNHVWHALVQKFCTGDLLRAGEVCSSRALGGGPRETTVTPVSPGSSSELLSIGVETVYAAFGFLLSGIPPQDQNASPTASSCWCATPSARTVIRPRR